MSCARCAGCTYLPQVVVHPLLLSAEVLSLWRRRRVVRGVVQGGGGGGTARRLFTKVWRVWAQGAASKVWDQSSGCPSVVCCHGGAFPMLSSLGKTARASQAKRLKVVFDEMEMGTFDATSLMSEFPIRGSLSVRRYVFQASWCPSTSRPSTDRRARLV